MKIWKMYFRYKSFLNEDDDCVILNMIEGKETKRLLANLL